MTAFNLPEKVQKLTVCIDDKELGVLTHDAIHDYKQTQNEFNLSLTMTEKGMDDSYRSGALHPIFAQNLPEGITVDTLHKGLLVTPKLTTCTY
ncbi:HipA N-terminal domain-containing protein [Pseudoalteromonas sp. B160]|uniref:HipA N-terminal domain-containing protein n=1 Tax=Pseudoalteromonas sp. B160 TaxID=630414 RepID=UPI00301CC27A